MKSFSALSRTNFLKEAEQSRFDVAIIGGGITGAGIALEAAAAGYKVFLCEANDFASGTSSKSTKLIHGGLRYLKNLQFGVVRETGVEREILYRNALHLVKPEPMLLPVTENGSLGMFSTRLALWMYELLAGVKPDMRFKMLSAEQTLRKEPLLDSANLKGAALYTEYRTDDARLCISVIKKAVSLGAVALNHAPCNGFIQSNKGKISGIYVNDALNNTKYAIKADYVVNAAGPWVDEVRKIDSLETEQNLVLSKGVHLVFPYARFPVGQSVYFDAPGGRMVFAIPRGNTTYAGTTDTLYKGTPAQATIEQEDLEYILKACNNMFPGLALRADDVLSSWTGLRPLIAKPGKGTAELSRKDEIFISPTGLVSIAGGKLTGYRRMAQKVLKTLLKSGLRKKNKTISTKYLKLAGGNFDSGAELQEYLERQIGEASQIGAGPQQIAAWINRYGSDTEKVVEMAYELWPQIQEKQLVPLFAELNYAVHCEMACSATDFWERRKASLYFNFNELEQEFNQGFDFLVSTLQLSPDEAAQMKYDFFAAMDSVKPKE